ncbi:protein kinase [Myxococcota bacterium]
MTVEPEELPCLSDDDLAAYAEGRLPDWQFQAVQSHLAHCETCRRLADEGARTQDSTPALENDVAGWNTIFARDDLVAGRYRILRFIARGGMGEVYEANDCDLQERVALKTVVSAAWDSIRAVRRLKAEVQLAHRVSHPNVCRIYDLGSHLIKGHGAAVSFLTMEFVEGKGLGERLRLGGALPVPEAQRIARQLLLGLNAAHGAGVLHRDFKSDNVMLRPETNGELSPVIMDFGLARALDTDKARVTSGANRGLVGTLGYMSPEQIEGKALSRSSDLYAFGVVWFEMLTGALPFTGESLAAAALGRLHRPPPAPSSLNPAVPEAIDRVVLRCLGRSAAERFGSASLVLTALDALNTAELTPRRRVRRFGAKKLAVGATVAIAGLVGAVLRWTPTTAHQTGHPATTLAAELTIGTEKTARTVPASEPPVRSPAERGAKLNTPSRRIGPPSRPSARELNPSGPGARAREPASKRSKAVVGSMPSQIPSVSLRPAASVQDRLLSADTNARPDESSTGTLGPRPDSSRPRRQEPPAQRLDRPRSRKARHPDWVNPFPPK